MDRGLKLLIDKVGVRELARQLKISHAAVLSWKRIPAERVHACEAISGIERSRLRPDLYPVERERKR